MTQSFLDSLGMVHSYTALKVGRRAGVRIDNVRIDRSA